MSLLCKLKKVVMKVNFLLSSGFRFSQWSLASILRTPRKRRRYSRHVSFGDELGLYNGCSEEKPLFVSSCKSFTCVRSFGRIRSSNDSREDIDTRADLFIQNFHRQLRMERQVSLELTYCSKLSCKEMGTGAQTDRETRIENDNSM